jgi:Fic family protein
VRYSDFEGSPAGRLVPTVYGARAFVPNPLPPELELGSIALALGEARGAIGELRGACRRLPDPYILIRPLQRLEAQTSSAMEGTHTTADELALAEAGVERNFGSDALEVRNYILALNWAEQELQRLPISGRLLKGAHERLLEAVGRARGQDKLPGQYKRDQNMIGGLRLDTALFIPPPAKEAEAAMADLERFINRDRKTSSHALIDMALVHYQFETIHPFADGNGRVGRMLISLMAVTEGLLEMPVLYMSPELEKRKDAYIDLLYAVSARGAWSDWLNFFLEIAALSANRTVRTIDRVLQLHADYRERAMSKYRSSNLLGVIDLVFTRPAVQARTVVERIGVTDAAARTLLRQLAGLAILEERADIYPTVWLARELIDVSRPEAE